MDRKTNLRETTHKPGEGKVFADSKMATGMANDSLHGSNTTKTFKPSGSISGPFGGKNTNK